MGQSLWNIVQRDGVEHARQQLLHDFHGWSIINDAQPDITGVTPEADAPYDSPARVAYSATMLGDRGANVPGYGQAYSLTEQPDEWISHDGDKWGTEWCYVLAEGGLLIGKVRWGTNPEPVEMLGLYRWDQPEPDWQAIEESAYAEVTA